MLLTAERMGGMAIVRAIGKSKVTVERAADLRFHRRAGADWRAAREAGQTVGDGVGTERLRIKKGRRRATPGPLVDVAILTAAARSAIPSAHRC